MPVCPNCGTSYEKDVRECVDCRVPLVSEEYYRKLSAIKEELCG